MGRFLRAVGRLFRWFGQSAYAVGGIALWGAVGVYNRIAPWAQTYLFSLAGTTGVWLVLIPTLVVLKVLTGWTWAAYAAAFLAVTLSAVIGLLWSPLGILLGLLIGKGRGAGARYVRLVGVILFVELMVSTYVLAIPFHRNLGAVPLLVMSGAAAVLGAAIWGGVLGPRFYQGIAIAIFLVTTLSFLFPETFAVVGSHGGIADSLVAVAITREPLRMLLWGVGFLLFAAGTLSQVLGQPTIRRVAWSLALLLGVLFVADWVVFQGGGARLTGLRFGGSEAAVEAKLPPGVTKVATLQFRSDRWLDIRGLVTPRTHCTMFGGDYVGARIMFADGSEDTLPENKWYEGKVPVALYKGKGTLVIFSAEVGTGDCGRRG